MTNETRSGRDRAWSGLLNGVMFILVGLIFCVAIPAFMVWRAKTLGASPAGQAITPGLNAVLAFGFGIAALALGIRLLRRNLAGLRADKAHPSAPRD
jgi:hypothetical protein